MVVIVYLFVHTLMMFFYVIYVPCFETQAFLFPSLSTWKTTNHWTMLSMLIRQGWLHPVLKPGGDTDCTAVCLSVYLSACFPSIPISLHLLVYMPAWSQSTTNSETLVRLIYSTLGLSVCWLGPSRLYRTGIEPSASSTHHLNHTAPSLWRQCRITSCFILT